MAKAGLARPTLAPGFSSLRYGNLGAGSCDHIVDATECLVVDLPESRHVHLVLEVGVRKRKKMFPE